MLPKVRRFLNNNDNNSYMNNHKLTSSVDRFSTKSSSSDSDNENNGKIVFALIFVFIGFSLYPNSFIYCTCG